MQSLIPGIKADTVLKKYFPSSFINLIYLINELLKPLPDSRKGREQ